MGFFKKLFGKPMNEFFAPVVGNAVPVSQVPDPTFAEELLGKGIAIEPAEGKVYANILVYRNKVIGGDICSADASGFIHGFEKT